MRYFISADIGTQGTKAALIDLEGNCRAVAFEPSSLIRGAGGTVEQDPEDMFGSVLRGIQGVMAQAGVAGDQVCGIGLDGQMAGIMGIDRDWNAVMPYDSWLDTRCEKYMPMIKAYGEREIIQLTGCPVTYAHGPKKIWWSRERPEVYKRIAKFVVPSAYIAGRLAGLRADQAFIDYTHLHFTGFADVEKQCWSDSLLNELGIDANKMPVIVRPWDIIGKLQAQYAHQAGLPSGIPIIAGCGDTAANTLGAGIVKPGQLFDIAGTASVLSGSVQQYRPDVDQRLLIYARSVLPGIWTPLAYVNGGGQCLAWFRSLLGKSEDQSYTFDELNSLAARVPIGSDSLLFIPHFNGRVCPNNPVMRGSWIGLNWTHDQASMYRAIMESIAYEYKIYMDTIQRLTETSSFSCVHAVGGGSKSELFNQIKANVLAVPYQTLQDQDSALVANAVIAGFGTGVFSNIEQTITRFNRPSQRIEPNAAAHQAYMPHAHHYQTALQVLTQLYRLIS